MASPTDWGSGERVFGPPSGTLDVDWLVPALLERVTVTPEAAREALVRAWTAHRDTAPEPGAAGGAGAAGDADPLATAAAALVRDAARDYGVPRGSGASSRDAPPRRASPGRPAGR